MRSLDAGGPSTRERRAWLAPVTIGCLALCLRLPRLGAASLWGDECHSLRMAIAAGQVSAWRLAHAVSGGFSTYFLLLAPYAGREVSEWALRLPSVLAGALLPAAMVMLGREVGTGRQAWLLGIASAVSPFFVWHSREARWYPLTWLLVGIGALAFVRFLRRRRGLDLLVLLMTGLLAASTYPPAALLLVVEIALLILGAGERRSALGWPGEWRCVRPLHIAAVVCLIAGSLWAWRTLIGPAVREGAAGYRFRNLGGPDPWAAAYTVVAWSTGYTLGPGPYEWHTLRPGELAIADAAMLAAGSIALLALVAVGVVGLARRHGRFLALAFVILAALPPAVLIAAGRWTGHVYAPRHSGLSCLFVLCLVTAGLEHGKQRRSVRALAGVLFGLQIVSLHNLYVDPRYSREEVRGAARLVESQESRHDLVLIFGGLRDPWEHYYNGVALWRKVDPRDHEKWSAEGLRKRLERHAVVWTVQGRVWETPGVEALLASVREWGHPTAERRFPGGVVVTRYEGRRSTG